MRARFLPTSVAREDFGVILGEVLTGFPGGFLAGYWRVALRFLGVVWVVFGWVLASNQRVPGVLLERAWSSP
eukprot:6753690-Alexandrium_andersonii.AAC.1